MESDKPYSFQSTCAGEHRKYIQHLFVRGFLRMDSPVSSQKNILRTFGISGMPPFLIHKIRSLEVAGKSRAVQQLISSW